MNAPKRIARWFLKHWAHCVDKHCPMCKPMDWAHWRRCAGASDRYDFCDHCVRIHAKHYVDRLRGG